MECVNSAQLYIAICDDDIDDCRLIMEMTEEILSHENITCQISTYSDAATLLRAIQCGKQFQILLLDVMMKGLNGMDLATALRRQENQASIVFISSNRDLALRGYEVAASRYLAKPVVRERLQEALMFCYQQNCVKKEILLPTVNGQRRISLANILYAETWERGARIHTAEEKLITKQHMSELLELLPKRQFMLCHRAYIINLAHVKTIRSNELELKNGELLPVSKYRFDDLRRRLISYLES